MGQGLEARIAPHEAPPPISGGGQVLPCGAWPLISAGQNSELWEDGGRSEVGKRLPCSCLSWSRAVGAMGGTGDLGGPFLPCPFPLLDLNMEQGDVVGV